MRACLITASILTCALAREAAARQKTAGKKIWPAQPAGAKAAASRQPDLPCVLKYVSFPLVVLNIE